MSVARRVAPAINETVVPVLGDGVFPVRRIYCVGRNYLEHIREMKEADERDPPFFFQKPRDSIVQHDARRSLSAADVRLPVRRRTGSGDRPARAATSESMTRSIMSLAMRPASTSRAATANAMRATCDCRGKSERASTLGALRHDHARIRRRASPAWQHHSAVNGQERQRGDLAADDLECAGDRDATLAAGHARQPAISFLPERRQASAPSFPATRSKSQSMD